MNNNCFNCLQILIKPPESTRMKLVFKKFLDLNLIGLYGLKWLNDLNSNTGIPAYSDTLGNSQIAEAANHCSRMIGKWPVSLKQLLRLSVLLGVLRFRIR